MVPPGFETERKDMARQKFINIYPNGIENNFIGFRARDRLYSVRSYLTLADLSRIEVALRLRIESCEENHEWKEARLWRSTHEKISGIIEKLKGGEE